MRHPIIPFALLALVAAGLGGCGKHTTAPEVPAVTEPVILTPINATIKKIEVVKFPAKAPDGSDWDVSIVASYRRPDLFVALTRENQPGDYTSNTVTNAVPGTRYTFTAAVSGRLPATIPYGTSRRVYVMDEDFGGDHDRVGWITVNLPKAYGQDNARNLDYTFTDSGNRLSVRVVGTWAY